MRSNGSIIIGNSRWRYVKYFIGSMLFVAAGIFILIKEPSRKIEVLLGVVFFGVCSAVFLWQIMDQRPRLIIDDRGIRDRTLGVGTIPWTEITGAYIKSISGNEFICLEVRDPAMYRKKQSKVRTAMAAANRKLGFTDLSLNLTGLDLNTQELFELIMKRVETTSE